MKLTYKEKTETEITVDIELPAYFLRMGIYYKIMPDKMLSVCSNFISISEVGGYNYNSTINDLLDKDFSYQVPEHEFVNKYNELLSTINPLVNNASIYIQEFGEGEE